MGSCLASGNCICWLADACCVCLKHTMNATALTQPTFQASIGNSGHLPVSLITFIPPSSSPAFIVQVGLAMDKAQAEANRQRQALLKEELDRMIKMQEDRKRMEAEEMMEYAKKEQVRSWIEQNLFLIT